MSYATHKATTKPAAKPVQSVDTLPDSAYIRSAQLVSENGRPGLLPFGNSTLWRKVRAKEFPAPVRLSERVTAWRLGDVRAWLVKQQQGGKP